MTSISRPVIPPRAPELTRVEWSVMIPTYNCAHFLAETLTSVLVQDPGPDQMQIEVVDDASDDAPEEVVAAVGRGRVSFFRQPSHQGQHRNLATCLQRSRGNIVHLLHGDDLVLPGFYAALNRGFASDDQIGAAFCRWQVIDASGHTMTIARPEQTAPGVLPDALGLIASEQRIVTPSIAVRRLIWEQLGGFDPRLACAEDWEMWVRIAAAHPIWYEPSLLASYRSHAHSTTGRNFRNAHELRYSALAIDIFRPYLPPSRKRSIVTSARSAYAETALANAGRLAEEGDIPAMRAHLRAALRLRRSPGVLRRAAGLLLGSAAQR